MYSYLFYYYVTGCLLTVLLSFIVLYIPLKKKMQLPWKIMAIVAAASSYMFVAKMLKYYTFNTYIDFAVWPEILDNIIKHGIPISTLEVSFHPNIDNWFAVHFSPLIYLFAIPFKIWPSNEAIIILNCILMISAGIPLYKIAMLSQNNKDFAIFMVVLLLWFPPFQYITLYEFEMLRFGIPIILWMLYFWDKGNMLGYFVFVFLAVLIREEVGLTIMLFGIYLFLIKKKSVAGVTTSIIGLSAFVIITHIIMPALSKTGSYHPVAAGSFSAFGTTIGEILVNIIKQPLFTLKTILQPIKLANIFMCFFPLLFIPLLSPAVLLSTAAVFGIGLLSSSVTHISYMLYYIAIAIPFIFYAFIQGWPKLLIIQKALIHNGYKVNNNSFNSSAAFCVLTGLLVTNIFFGPSPISLQFWSKNLRPAPFNTQNYHYSAYKITEHHGKADKFYELIPNSAVVSTQQFLAPRLYARKGIMIFPMVEIAGSKIMADYVFLDKTNNGLSKESPAYIHQKQFDRVEMDTINWNLIKSDDKYFLYKRVKYTE